MRKAYGPGGSSYFSGPFSTRSREGVDRPCVPPRRSTCAFRSHSLLSFSRCLSPTRVYRNVGNVQVFCIETIKSFMGAWKGYTELRRHTVAGANEPRIERFEVENVNLSTLFAKLCTVCYTRLLINSLLCNSITCLFSTLYYTLADSWSFTYGAHTPPSPLDTQLLVFPFLICIS